jgi:phosphate transport system protein
VHRGRGRLAERHRRAAAEPGPADRAGDRRHRDIQAVRAEAEENATDALLVHQPVAGDLRAVVSAIRTAGDLERMGALARHVAQVAVLGSALTW